MQKLLLILSSFTIGGQTFPLISLKQPTQIIEKMAMDTPLKEKDLINFYVKESNSYDHLSHVLEAILFHNEIFNKTAEEIHEELKKKINEDSSVINIGKNPEKLEEYFNNLLGDKVEKGFKLCSVYNWMKTFPYATSLLKAIKLSITKMHQPLALLVNDKLWYEDNALVYVGYDDETQKVAYIETDKPYMVQYKDYKEVNQTRVDSYSYENWFFLPTQISEIIKKPTADDWKKLKVQKQELPEYHLATAVQDLLPLWFAERTQTEIYQELRKITKTPEESKNIVIKDQSIAQYLNKLGSLDGTNYVVKEIDSNYGSSKHEIEMFNQAIKDSIKKDIPVILTNGQVSFVIIQINSDPTNPWNSSYTGMSSEKGKVISLTATQIIKLNKNGGHILGESKALDEIKGHDEVIIEKIPVQEAIKTDLENGDNVKAMSIDIDFGRFSPFHKINEIKTNFASLEFPNFETQIRKINGNYREIDGLKIETKDFPDLDLDTWESPLYQYANYEGENVEKTILETWVSVKLSFSHDSLDNLQLRFDFFVGSVTTKKETVKASDIKGEVKLKTGDIFELNRW